MTEHYELRRHNSVSVTQFVKEVSKLGKETRRIRGRKEEMQGKREKGLGFTVAKSQLFKIHGSKFEPHPRSDSGQATVVCVTHTMFFLRVRKDPFNGFFA